MAERSWTESEMRAALEGHWPYATEEEEGCPITLCHCGGADGWTGFDLEHVFDVLRGR